MILNQYSIVVLARDHNPTVLNPDFLLRQNIVDESWGWNLSQQPITTPAMSTVAYDSKVSILVDPTKATFTDNNQSEPGESKISNIAIGYTAALPHVNYHSVGVNFQVACPDNDPVAYIKTNLLADNLLDGSPGDLIGDGIKLSLHMGDRMFNLSIDTGLINTQKDGESSVIFSGNFHRDFESSGPGIISRSLENLSDDWQIFCDAVEKLKP